MKLNRLSYIAVPAILVAVLAFSCKSKTPKPETKSGVEYFRNLQFTEGPFNIEKGTYQLTPEEAKNVNSYKFSYDESGRLVSVEYVRGEVLLGYSEMGNASKITYTYTEGMQMKHFFDNKNQPVESQGVYAYQYSLDETGMRRGLMYLDKDGKMIENRNKVHSFTWSKLPDGMIKENRYNLAGTEVIMNEFCPFFELRFSYDDKGYLTRMANYQGDSLYNCTAENCGDIGVSYFAFVANEKGDLLNFSVHNVVGQLSNLYWGWAKRLNKVDENGYVIETAVYDQDDEYLGGKNVPVTQYEYDAYGAVVKIKNMDKDRNLINHPENGIAITEYVYDATGQRADTITYNKNSEPIAMK